jgi:hypothetical protein
MKYVVTPMNPSIDASLASKRNPVVGVMGDEPQSTHTCPPVIRPTPPLTVN